MNPNRKNLANAFLANPITDTATTMVYQTGYGSGKPAVPYFDTLTPAGQLSTAGNSEIVLVTALSGDTATIVRARKGTTAKPFSAGTIASNGIYSETTSAVGDIVMTLNSTPAPGRVFMDGSTYTKSGYPLLYQHVVNNPAYGTTGGASGSETFTLADMRERMPFGKSQNSPFTTLGGVGGTVEETLTVAQIPSHKHVSTLPNKNALTTTHSGSGIILNSGKAYATGSNSYASDQAFPGNANLLPSFTATGGGQAHNNMSPYIIVNYEVIAG